MGVGCNHKGANIQRGLRLAGHPVNIGLYQRLDTFHKQFLGNGRNTQTVAGIVHTAGIVIRAEQLHAAVSGAICLHALKHFLRIVEHHSGRVQFQRSIGYDAGIVPAFAGLIVEQEHVVGEIFAEAQTLCVGFHFGLCGFGDLDGFHDQGLLNIDCIQLHILQTNREYSGNYSSVKFNAQWSICCFFTLYRKKVCADAVIRPRHPLPPHRRCHPQEWYNFRPFPRRGSSEPKDGGLQHPDTRCTPRIFPCPAHCA